jgi:hypothetical protein
MNLKYWKWAVPVLCGLLALSGCPTETPEEITNNSYYTENGDLKLSLNRSYSVPHPNSTLVTDYILLDVEAGNYAQGVYKLGDTTVTPTPVLTDGGKTTLVKIEVPVRTADTKLTLSVTKDGTSVLNKEVTVKKGGTAAPAVLYGVTPMAFSEFYHDVTADVADIHPKSTAFNKEGPVAAPKKFITAGTRTGNNSAATANSMPKWTDAGEKVDTVSSATYGDNPHFVPTKNLAINYAEPMTKADHHQITGIKTVEVGVDFDLFANATLLKEAGRAVAVSTAVLAKVNDISWQTKDKIYKAKYLQPDAAWGKRDENALNTTVVGAWPKADPAKSVSYGGTWADKVIAVEFGPLTPPLDGTALWNTYFECLYGGYVEDSTGHKEPLVWLQNLFSHRGHTNFEVALNRAGISRMNNLTPAGNIHVVIFAYGLPDIIFDQDVVEFADSNATIEQGTTFYSSGTGNTATFINSTGAALNPARQMHVTGLSAAALADFKSKNGKLKKGTADVAATAYTLALEEDDGEIAITLKDGFFTGAFQGAYSLSINSDTVYKTPSFTVNRMISRPKLKTSANGAVLVEANTAAAAIEVAATETIAFENADFAKAILLAGRTVSSIAVESGTATAPAIATVLTRTSDTDPYGIKASVLTKGVVYKLTIVTSNFFDTERNSLASVIYYIKVKN